MEIVAQAIGIVGMVVNLLSYQQKKQRNLILFQLVGNGLFIFNFLLLGIVEGVFYIGTIMNILGVGRGIVFANKEKFHSDKPIWIAIFTVLYFAAYALTFTVFGTEPTVPNLVREFFPVIGMISGTVAVYMKDSKSARRVSFITSPAWLIYDIAAKSLGGIIGEVLNLISIVVGVIRHDLKKERTEDENTES